MEPLLMDKTKCMDKLLASFLLNNYQIFQLNKINLPENSVYSLLSSRWPEAARLAMGKNTWLLRGAQLLKTSVVATIQ